MIEKYSKKPKKKKHKKSIMHRKDGTCYLCRMLDGNWQRQTGLQEHHVFGGTANRKLSEQYGLKVYLCVPHHLTGPEAVHNNKMVMQMLRRKGQEAFEKYYPELDFKEIFGKNYIDQ